MKELRIYTFISMKIFMSIVSTWQELIVFEFQSIPFLWHVFLFRALLWPFHESLAVETIVFELGLNPIVRVIYRHAMNC